MSDGVRWHDVGAVRVVVLDRPQRRNAVDESTAALLLDVFREFDSSPDVSVAVLTGAGDCFCAGADLKALAGGERRALLPDGPRAPMDLPGFVSASRSSQPLRGPRWLAVWNLRCGATCGWRRRLRYSECSAGASACRSSISAPSVCPG